MMKIKQKKEQIKVSNKKIKKIRKKEKQKKKQKKKRKNKKRKLIIKTSNGEQKKYLHLMN